ncbi:MAG TPA: ChbG/HpnK family deacetylase [Xanthobacteraceae bacterium]|nr:ChbG/HpnK family deacetylase [Xanthobacteraceae bacterium]
MTVVADERNAEAAQQRAPRRVWLVADDYGISPAVNAAIRDLALRRRLSATSVMVVAPSFDRSEAARLAMPDGAGVKLAIGLHLTLTAPYRPLSAGFRPTRAGAFLPLAPLMGRAALGRLDQVALSAEIAAQLAAFRTAFGRPPDFVDGHQHVQLLPAIGETLLAAMKETAPRAWARQCGRADSPVRRLSDPKGLLLDFLSRRFRARAAALGVRTNPAFAGTYDYGSKMPIAELFPQFLDAMPDGGVVMCHPGRIDDELARLDPLTDLREQEYAYLAGDEFEALLRRQGVALA